MTPSLRERRVELAFTWLLDQVLSPTSSGIVADAEIGFGFGVELALADPELIWLLWHQLETQTESFSRPRAYAQEVARVLHAIMDGERDDELEPDP